MPFTDPERIQALTDRIHTIVDDRLAVVSVTIVEEITDRFADLDQRVAKKSSELHSTLSEMLTQMTVVRERTAKLEGFKEHLASTPTPLGLIARVVDKAFEKLSGWPLVIIVAIISATILILNWPGS